MRLLTTQTDVGELELRAMTMVAQAGRNGLDRPQVAMLDALQKFVLHTTVDVAVLVPVSPETLAGHVTDAGQARQFVRFLVALSLADGPPSVEQMSLISSFTEALGVQEPAVAVVRHLAKGHRLRFRIAFFRHSHVRNYFRNTYRLGGGIGALIKGLLVFRGVREDATIASRFRSLGNLPETTLGRQFFDHCVAQGIAFPGEKGGFPIGAVYHDFTHVLAGYDTSPEGEMKAAAFQAGFTDDDDDFFTALFAIVIHTSGVNLAPFPMPKLPGRIGQDKLALEVLHALQRGSAVEVDLGNQWDFWRHVEQPIETVRDELGVPPINEELLCA